MVNTEITQNDDSLIPEKIVEERMCSTLKYRQFYKFRYLVGLGDENIEKIKLVAYR